MNNKHQNLEDLFKDALQHEEAPYDPSEWDKLSSQLDKTMPATPKPKSIFKWVVGTTIAAAMIAGALFLVNSENNRKVQELKTSENSLDQRILSENTDSNTSSDDKSSAENDLNESHFDNESQDQVHHEVNDDQTDNMNISAPVKDDEQNVEKKESKDLKTIESLDQENDITTKEDHDKDALNIKQDVNSNTLNAVPEISLSHSSICESEAVEASIQNSGKFKTLEWFLDGQRIGTGENIKLTPTKAGLNQITVIPNGMGENKTTVDINVMESPKPTIQWRKANPATAEVELYHDIDGVKSIWFVDGKKLNSQENMVKVNLEKSGSYDVKVIAENTSGCESTTLESIYILDDFQLLAPNAFTPDGDGVNDNFIPKSLEVMSREFTMIIYDRIGNPVYQTSSINMPWDGKNISTGKQAKAGSYVWTVKFKDSQQTYQGVISLLR